MKYAQAIAVSGAILGLAGCASAPKVAVLAPVGPSPAEHSAVMSGGFLQVYSAQRKADIDLVTEEWRWNNDFGKNQFLTEPAHTEYTIYAQDGGVLKRVPNARDADDAEPTLLMLPTGTYKVEAQAEDRREGTVTVTIPVVIQKGQTTVAHLEGDWAPSHQYTDGDVVRLPDGQIAGWRAQEQPKYVSHPPAPSGE
jgi:hypothetical protein